MRVAFDTSATRGRKTGIGIYTQGLVRALQTYTPGLQIVELNDGAGVEQRTPARILHEQLNIPRMVRAAQVDVVHLTGFAAPVRHSSPVILTVHDLIGVLFARNFPPAARFYWSRYLPFTLRSADKIIAVSENTKRDILRTEKIPPDRIQVISEAADERFQPISDQQSLQAVRQAFQLPHSFFLFVGTLEPRKGIDTIISAYAQASGEVAEDLVIVGKRGWSWNKFFQQVTALGLERRVRFLDYVPDDALPALYNLARAFVFPSRYEGFGLPVLQALACGTPVLSSNAASLPEVIGSAGIMVPPDDIEGFARELIRLSRDSGLCADLRARGLDRAKSFSWERIARATVQVYQSISGQPSSSVNH